MQQEALFMRRVVFSLLALSALSLSLALGFALHPAVGFIALSVLSLAGALTTFASYSKDHPEGES